MKTLLQIFFHHLFDLQVIFKSMGVADDTFHCHFLLFPCRVHNDHIFLLRLKDTEKGAFVNVLVKVGKHLSHLAY